jgi:hypothetical protein
MGQLVPLRRGKSGNDVRDGIDGKASNAIRELVTNRSMKFGGGAVQVERS